VNRFPRTPLALCASIACAATSVVWLAPGAPATQAATVAPVARNAATRPSPAPGGTGASDVTDLGAGGWQVASSATATQPGAQISAPSFDARSWLRVANDSADAPGTEIEALLQNGRCPGDSGLQPVNRSSDSRHSVFFSDNMRKCYGYEDQATHLRAGVLELARREGFWEHYNPLTARGQGGEQFAWTAALILDLLAAEESAA